MSVINSERDMDHLLADLGVPGEFSAKDHQRIAERLPLEVLINAAMSKAAPLEYTRALTPSHKFDVALRLVTAWLKTPDLRLGQLLENAGKSTSAKWGELEQTSDLFYIEDGELMRRVEAFVSEHTKPRE